MNNKKGTKLCIFAIVILFLTTARLLLVLVGTNYNFKKNFKTLGGVQVINKIKNPDQVTNEELRETGFILKNRASFVAQFCEVGKLGSDKIVVKASGTKDVDEVLKHLGTNGGVINCVYALDSEGHENVSMNSNVNRATLLRTMEE